MVFYGYGMTGSRQLTGANVSGGRPAQQQQFLGMTVPQQAPEPETSPFADLENGVQQLEESQMGYAKASAYYKGTQPEFFASLRMRIAMGATGVIFNFNFARLPVDAVAERLEIAGISCIDREALATIDSAWLGNQLDIYAPDVMRSACKFGDAYLMVWPNPDGDVDGDGVPDIDIFYQSPRLCRVFYDDNNERKKKYAIKRWVDPASGWIFANLYYPDRIEKYMQTPVPTSAAEQQAVPEWTKRKDAPDEEWPIPNPYDEVPFFHFRNGFPYGEPEHINAYGPQDAIHKVVISHVASIDYNAFPQRYAILAEGYDTSEAAFGDEGDYAFAINTSATLDTGVDPKSQLTADPASVWFMKGIQSYGQFPPGDPQAFLQPFEQYIHAMAVVTNTPMHFMDPIVSNVSGESLRLIEAPFAKKVRNRQMMFGTTWRDLFRFVLRVQNANEQAPVRVNWTPASTVNDLATLQAQVIKAQLGVPPYQLLLEQGYTPEQLVLWKIQEATQSPVFFQTLAGQIVEPPAGELSS
jgi:Phage portal protein, SPP1 Gp6-like